MKLQKEEKSKQGKKNRAAGKRFEQAVRKNLEEKGWVCAKWTNQVEDNKLVPIKPKFNPFTKSVMYTGTGFPDYIAYQEVYVDWGLRCKDGKIGCTYSIIGVECKGGNETNHYLDKDEKEKCKWLLKNNIFSVILIATKGKKRGQIIYTEFK